MSERDDQMLAQLLRQISPTDGTVVAIPQAAKIIRQAASALERRSPSRPLILEEAAKEWDLMREALVEWGLLSLVVEVAVRNEEPAFYDQVLSAIRSTRAALSHDGKAPAKEGSAEGEARSEALPAQESA